MLFSESIRETEREREMENGVAGEELDAAFSLAESIAASCKRQKSCITEEDTCRPSQHRRLPEWRANGSVSSNGTICRRNSFPSDTAHLGSPSDAQKTPVGVPREANWTLLPSPCRLNPKVKYPAMRFGGQVVYCRTFADVERAAMELLELIEAKKRNVEQVSLGLDIEWRPTFRRGEASRKAAVLQICMDNDWCYVMHIIHSGIPPTLQSILEDATSTKVGVGIYNDVAKVMKDYNVRIQVVADLSGLANLKFGGVRRNWSLGALTEMLTCKELEKPKKIRLGNWEADVLSKEQIHYAATDAYASWYLFQVLKSFSDAADNPLVDKDANDVQS